MSRNTNNWMANEGRANFQLPYVGKRSVSLELREGKNVEVIGHEHISEVINTVMGKTEKGVGIRGEAQILKENLEMQSTRLKVLRVHLLKLWMNF